MSLIYNQYESHIHFIINGKISFLPKEDPRYKKVVALLEKEKFDEVEKLVSAEKVIEEESSLRIENGTMFYKDEQLPQSLSDQIFENKLSGESIEPFLKIWTSLKYNDDFKTKRKEILKLLDKVIPFEHACIVPNAKSIEIKNFYELSEKHPYFSYIEKRKTVNDIIVDLGIKSDKLYKLAKKELFKNYLDWKFIYFLKAFSKLNINNIIVLYEKNIHQLFTSVTFAERCVKFFELNNFTEQRIMSLFTEKFHSDYFVDTIKYYKKIEKVANLTFSEKGSWEIWHQEVMAYVAKNNKNFVIFDWAAKFPELKDLEYRIDDNFSIRLPHNSMELQSWGTTMGNCIGGYKDRAKTTKTMLLLAIYKNDSLLYNLEIVSKKVIQFERKHKTSVNQDEKKLVMAHLKKYKIVK